MAYQVRWEAPDQAKTLDVSQVVALEQAIAAAGTSLDELMQRAGASAAQFIRNRWQPGADVVVFCGTGNNGGDGWVIGQLLAQAGYSVRLISSCKAEQVNAHPAREAAARCLAATVGLESFRLAVDPALDEVLAWAAEADVVVDALLGTGFHYDSLREPTRGYVQVIASLGNPDGGGQSATRPHIVAIDVPSGLNAQTGTATDPVVRADSTVTMMALKTGIMTPSGRKLCGALAVAHIADLDPFLPKA
ncbi:MAG: NAD(P)H-hydrate epimerase [Eggerthellaceae bacterium]